MGDGTGKQRRHGFLSSSVERSRRRTALVDMAERVLKASDTSVLIFLRFEISLAGATERASAEHLLLARTSLVLLGCNKSGGERCNKRIETCRPSPWFKFGM